MDIAQTLVGHNSENEVLVNGFNEPGSYVRRVRYETGILELEALIERATSCKQLISYKCNNSRLLANPGRCFNYNLVNNYLSSIHSLI